MSKVIKIGICKNKGDKIINVNTVKAVQGKGLVNDRKFKEDNNKKSQLTLIEVENINFYNGISGSNLAPLEFRRNIITQGIKLNELNGKDFFIGNIKVKAHDLCRPCKYLENLLKKNNIIKELILKSGLRCEILTSGEISVGDIIRVDD